MAIYYITILGGILILIFLGLLILIGTIICLVSIIKAKKQKKKINKISTLIGGVLIILPLVFITSIYDWENEISQDDNTSDYNNLVEKWSNSYTSWNTANDDVIQYLLNGIESRDVEVISNMFSEETRNKSNFQSEVNEFLENVPENFNEYTYKAISSSQPGSYSKGTSTRELNSSYIFQKDNKVIYLSYSGYIENDSEKSKIGLEKLYLQSAEAKILEREEENDIQSKYLFMMPDGSDYRERTTTDNQEKYVIKDNQILVCYIDVDEEFEFKIIKNNYPYRFNSYDRSITKDELINAYKQSRKVEDIVSLLGDPNAISYSRTVKNILYELKDVDTTIYAFIDYDVYYRLGSCSFYTQDGKYIETIKSSQMEDEGR